MLNAEGEKIGEITTGYHCISVDKSVAMALVDAAYGKLGTELKVQIRKKTFDGVVVKKKFYIGAVHTITAAISKEQFFMNRIIISGIIPTKMARCCEIFKFCS